MATHSYLPASFTKVHFHTIWVEITTCHDRLSIRDMGFAQRHEEVACRGPVAFYVGRNQQNIAQEV